MGDQKTFGLSKHERLHEALLINDLFKSADSFKGFPIIFSYKFSEKPLLSPFAFIFTVSKRKFKRAVDRNRIKRLMKDRLRLQKPALVQALNGRYLYGSLIFTGKELPDYRAIDHSISKFIRQLHEKSIS